MLTCLIISAFVLMLYGILGLGWINESEEGASLVALALLMLVFGALVLL